MVSWNTLRTPHGGSGRRALAATLLGLLTLAPLACGRSQNTPEGETNAQVEPAAQREPLDLSSLDVCRRVPGKDVAQAVGGQLVDVLPRAASDDQPARCRYSLTLTAGGRDVQRTYIVSLMTPSDFEKRGVQVSNPMTPVPRLGDVAYVTYAAAGEPMDLYVLRRGVATIQITGEDRASLIKIAKVVLTHL